MNNRIYDELAKILRGVQRAQLMESAQQSDERSGATCKKKKGKEKEVS